MASRPFLCFLLPLAPPAVVNGHSSAAVADGSAVVGSTGLPPARPAAPISIRSIPGWLLALGVAGRSAWLMLGLVRLARLRRNSMPASVPIEMQVLVDRIAPAAELRRGLEFQQPVTFGLRRPIVLLPRRFAELSSAAQQAVLCHELLHATRRDWAWTLAEECVRTLFWFHPGVRYVLRQTRLAREEIVDRLSAGIIGCRDTYIDALLAFADAPASAPASPLGRGRIRIISPPTPKGRLQRRASRPRVDGSSRLPTARCTAPSRSCSNHSRLAEP